MTQFYTAEHMARLADGIKSLSARCLIIRERCLIQTFSNERAKEIAQHGFARRLGTLVRCMRNAFVALPPDLACVPTDDDVYDATIQLQAFVINVFGCLDNLAWVWVLERDLKQANGSKIPSEWVGLRPSNTLIRKSFSPAFQTYLDGLASWFGYQEGFRHALAHQIPLYIPPFAIAPENKRRYHELQNVIERLVLSGDHEEANLRRQELDSFKFFRPVIVHSWTSATPLAFHPQMIADFRTVDEISVRIFDELSQSSA